MKIFVRETVVTRMGQLGSLMCAALLIAGCGSSGSSSSGGGGSAETGSVSLEVTGTTVMAIASNGSLLAQDGSAGKSPIGGKYTLTLTGLPLNQKIRFFVLTDGGVFPMKFNNNNALNLSSTAPVDLGLVTPVNTINGPVANPTKLPPLPNLSDDQPNIIPPVVKAPTPPSLSQAQLVTAGLDLVKSGAFAQAKNYFDSAVALGGSGQDIDAARFFRALSRVSAVVFTLYSDGNENDFNSIGDLLDIAGCNPSDLTRTSWDVIACLPHPAAFPSGGIQALLSGRGEADLVASLADLNAVSSAFNRVWVEPGNKTTVESDYGDVLFFTGVVEGLIGLAELQQAYVALPSIDNSTNKTIQQILAAYPTFLTLAASPATSAKTHFDNGLAALQAAVTEIKGESDNQLDDYISLVGMSAKEQTDLTSGLQGWRNSLNGNGVVSGITVNLTSVFSPGVSIRSLLPPFTNNKPTGLLPSTWNSIVISGTNINKDVLPPFGTADILQ